MESIKLYILESYNELLNKVTWPTWSALTNTTTVVIIGSVILSLIIFVMDIFSSGLTRAIYELG